MMYRHAVIFWLTLALGAYGIVDMLWKGSWGFLISLLIPIFIFAVIFLLYKYQPGQRKRTPKVKPSVRTMTKTASARKQQTTSKRKAYPFHVIEGSKGKNEEEQPKYH
ncbi:hypothetical protein CPY53_04465 [Paenibacillus polymyxa]|nr:MULTISPECIES: hypothetical protein [Paenibacillus]KKD53688.1 hypothetical protein C400_14625 [Paenibacillus sp. ICGEB2008]MBE3649457.1 hypothetical protein [Paenibacillus polymyxa]MBE7896548.1 hypothetical protein [Paenibacillus polymyxa]MBG9765549.1 hypothetical protein [Paenibacillus polymyxa]MCC3257075.1 hypothetical protein [Paenibacillus polymyxa]